MSKIVVDSSAVLALMHGEPGAAIVGTLLNDALISTVNLAEILSKLLSAGWKREIALRDLHDLHLVTADYTVDLAEDAALLVVETRGQGLSLGDRSCLALARREKLPVVTADRVWAKVDVGVKIELIR